MQTSNVTIDGKEYALSFNMRSVEWLEDHGVTVDTLAFLNPTSTANFKLTKLVRVLYAGIGMERTGMTVEKFFEIAKHHLHDRADKNNPLAMAAKEFVNYFFGPPGVLKNSKREAEKAEKK